MVLGLLINNFVLALALYISQEFLIAGKRRKLLYFVSIFAVIVAVNHFIADSFLDIILCSFFGTWFSVKPIKSVVRAINIQLTIIVMFQVVIMLFGSTAFLLFERDEIKNSHVYNLSIQILCLILAVFISKFRNKVLLKERSNKLLFWDIVSKSLFLIFINIVLPLLFYEIGEIYYAICILFVLVTVVDNIIHFHATELEEINTKNINNAEIMEVRVESINSKYDEIIKVKHYFYGLYKSLILFINDNNMAGLKTYFNEKITPINKDLLNIQANFRQLELIEIAVIKALLANLINTVSSMPNVLLTLDVDTKIQRINIDDMDIFMLLNIFIENAVEELKTQGNSYIHINIFEIQSKYVFVIENSVYGTNIKENNAHKGLDIARDIVQKYRNVGLQTIHELNYFRQVLEVGQY